MRRCRCVVLTFFFAGVGSGGFVGLTRPVFGRLHFGQPTYGAFGGEDLLLAREDADAAPLLFLQQQKAIVSVEWKIVSGGETAAGALTWKQQQKKVKKVKKSESIIEK